MGINGGLADEYLDWIFMNKLGFRRREADRFRPLGEALFRIDYVWCNEFDENRAADGLCLRREFLEDDRSEGLFGGAKVLEVLAEFAIRIDSEYVGDPSDPDPGVIFYMFLENLGLLRMGNVKKCSETFIKNSVWHWMTEDPGVIFGFQNTSKTAQLWSYMLKWVSNV